MAILQEDSPKKSFGVRVDSAETIYLLMRNALPFVREYTPDFLDQFEGMTDVEMIMDPRFRNLIILEDLSNTKLGGVLFEGERTTIGISSSSDTEHPEFTIITTITPTLQEKAQRPFYDRERVLSVQRLLLQAGVDLALTTNGVSTFLGLQDFAEGNLHISFGPEGENVFKELAREMFPDVPYGLIEGKMRRDKNFGLTLKYETLFTDQAAFASRLNMYAGTYEKLLRALYQERSTSLPNTPIVLSRSIVSNKTERKFSVTTVSLFNNKT